MAAALLTIGTELTRGEIVNTNASWLAAELTALGFEVHEVTTIDDVPARIVATLTRLGGEARVIVSTGGLGPTTDDVTASAAATALGVSLQRDPSSLDAIRRRVEALGRPLNDSNAKQADFPEGAEVLPNPIGTAPGFAVTVGGARCFFLPGVPREMKKMFAEQVVPRVRGLAPNDTHQIRIKTFGLPESIVGDKLAGVEEAFPGVTLGYRASFPEIEVKVHARAGDDHAARDVATRAAAEVRARLGAVVYGEGDDTFPLVVGRAVRSRGWRLALAESCTGGLVGHLLTREPVSDIFVADAVTYANSAKTRLLGVAEDVLRWHGAVSAEVAAAMAEGARRLCETDLALAITGIAGPSGGTPEKPVGLVYLAVAHPAGTVTRERTFPGDRSQIQQLAAWAGMSLVRDVCLGKTS